jgi:hypothetical protein
MQMLSSFPHYAMVRCEIVWSPGASQAHLISCATSSLVPLNNCHSEAIKERRGEQVSVKMTCEQGNLGYSITQVGMQS